MRRRARMTKVPILVVDDDLDLLAAVAEVLACEDYAIHTATNGVEALQEVERCGPQLALLDLYMPVLDGWSFAQEIHERHLALKILVMTAAPNVKVWAAEIQADGYLAKPFELPHLLREVDRLCAP